MILNSNDILLALLGGILIGFSVTLMLLFSGRVTGISGIAYRFLTLSKKDWIWRGFFLGGLLFGGFLLFQFFPSRLENTLHLGDLRLATAGILVGFGTILGNGCTSGHGVCGVSRFSLRSIAATGTFMLFGVLTVLLIRLYLGGN